MKRRYAAFVLLVCCWCLSPSAAQPLFSSASPSHRLSTGRGTASAPPVLGPKALLVDPSATPQQLSSSPYIFATFQEAIAHLSPGTSPSDRMTIYLKPAVYWLDNPDDPAVREGQNNRPPIAMTVNCPWLQIIGLSENPQDVVLAVNRGQTQGAEGNFTMLSFHGDGLHLENLTLGNYCNVDLVYPRDTTQNRPRRADAITQAQLAFADGDFLTADNCRFISRLNTCPLNGGKRTIFTRCHFESTDDALEGRALYRQCEFVFHSSKPFYMTSRAGAIMLDSDFHLLTSPPSSPVLYTAAPQQSARQFFTKISSPLILARCRFHTACPDLLSIAWTPYPSATLRCYEQALTLNDKPFSMAAAAPENTVQLPENPWKERFDQLNTASTDELFTMLDQLAIHAELSPQETHIIGDSTLSYTLSYYTLGDRLLKTASGPSYDAKNPTDTLQTQLVEKTAENGLKAAAAIFIRPTLLPAPAVLRQPVVRNAGQGLLAVDYELQLDGRDDHSLVTWYRCTDKKGNNALPVAVSRMDKPETTYRLQPGDAGHYLMVRLEPKHVRSNGGKAVTAIYRKKIKEKDVLMPYVLETDFQNFPTEPQPAIGEGLWTLDGYKPADTDRQPWQPKADSWFYGSGIDGHRGTGLLQKEKGARLLYTPTRAQLSQSPSSPVEYTAALPQSTTMAVTWRMDPGKTAGQGFGSATDQYLDLYIHYDATTRSGYGLRIIRTTKHANAVDMMLMRFEEGRGEVLTEPVSTTCFLPDCTVRLWTSDGQLCAHVSTTTPQRESTLAKEVNLSCHIPPTTAYGLGLQHTGSVGASAIMLHSVKAQWQH